MSKEIKISCSIQDRVSIDDLVPTQKNLKSLSKENFEKLRKSIIKNGFFFPIGIWDHDGVLKLLDGHQRLLTLKELRNEGYIIPLVPVFRVYASNEKQAREMLLHSVSQYGHVEKQGLYELMIEWDMKIDDLGSFELPISSLDIQSFDLEFFKDNKIEPGCDEDETPELPTESKVKRGDIFILGSHRLMCGDSTMIDDVEKLMDGQKADMVFTDPPYNQETEGGFTYEMGAALKKQISEIAHLCDFNPEMFLNVLPTLFQKNTLNAYCFCNKDLVVDYLKWARESGYAYNILIWKKPTAIPIGGSYRPDVEYLLVFRKSGIFNGNIYDVNYSKVLEHGREKNKVHPTMKPVEMIENQLLIASNKGSVVSDLFGGSGSTLIACEKTYRKCFMMELEPKYCAVILDRWEKYSGKKAIHENGTSWESIKSS